MLTAESVPSCVVTITAHQDVVAEAPVMSRCRQPRVAQALRVRLIRGRVGRDTDRSLDDTVTVDGEDSSIRLLLAGSVEQLPNFDGKGIVLTSKTEASRILFERIQCIEEAVGRVVRDVYSVLDVPCTRFIKLSRRPRP